MIKIGKKKARAESMRSTMHYYPQYFFPNIISGNELIRFGIRAKTTQTVKCFRKHKERFFIAFILFLMWFFVMFMSWRALKSFTMFRYAEDVNDTFGRLSHSTSRINSSNKVSSNGAHHSNCFVDEQFESNCLCLTLWFSSRTCSAYIRIYS